MNNRSTSAETIGAEDWAGAMGDRWLAHVDQFESMIAPVGDALLARADYQPGERVVDIGCGGGASSRAIAARVAPGGRVMGVDISQALVAECVRRAMAAGLTNLGFIAADAASVQTAAAPFDRLHSRFGSMFFPEPAAAFRHLATLLRPGGRADFAVWAPAKDSPWVSELMQILRRHIDMPKPEPRAPGPFALDDPNYFVSLLHPAGFVELDFKLWRGRQLLGGTGASAQRAVEFLIKAMSFGDVVLEQSASVQQRVKQELQELFARHETADGVSMEAIAWLVSARRC